MSTTELNVAELFERAVVKLPAPRRVAWTADELLDTLFEEPAWLVPGLLPVGLTILAGKRKIGKSWLALQLAGATGSGGKFLNRDIERGKVLYLALEDSERRLKSRIEKQRWPHGVAVDFRLAWQPLDQGGLAELHDAIRTGYKLIVIDTLSRALTRATDQLNVGDMTVVVGDIQYTAQIAGITIMVVDHHSKVAGVPGAENPVDDVLGSSAKGAVADAVWGLYRERGKRGAKLMATGRDLEDQTIAIEFDAVTGAWQVAADEVALTSAQQEIVDVLREAGQATAGEIAKLTGQDRGNCFKRLQDLVGMHIVRTDGKYYSLVAA